MTTLIKNNIAITIPESGYAFNPIIAECINPDNKKINAIVGETAFIDGDYYSYTNSDATLTSAGYYQNVNGSSVFVADSNYFTGFIPFSTDKGQKLRFNGLIDKNVFFAIRLSTGDGQLVEVNGATSPITNLDLSLPENANGIRVTTKVTVPFTLNIGTFESVEISDIAVQISSVGYNGKNYFDLSGLSRLLFNRDEFYNVQMVDNILHKIMRVFFSYDLIPIGYADINIIWGAKQIAGIGEKIYKELIYFPSYPYTIPVMRDADSKLRMRIDSGNYLDEVQILAGVKYNIPVNHPEANKSVTIRIDNTDDILNDQSIFTDEFDHTFRDTYDSTGITVLKVGCEPSGGIYLRWINMLGEWCYFLFRPQSDELKSESSDISFKEIYNTVKPTDPLNAGNVLYHAGTGQSIAKSGIKTMNIAAVFLDQDIFDYVLSITLSPIVDLYLGKNNDKDTWVRISVVDSEIIKSKEVLQNIQLEIQLPDILNQSL